MSDTALKINEDEAGTYSHLPVLRWAHETLGGSILEFGGGLYSTAYLYEEEQKGCKTVTVEQDPQWRAWLRERYPGHKVKARVEVPKFFDVVLIDDGVGEWTWIDHRAKMLELMRGHFGIALVHDWHIGPGHRGELVESFRYHGWYAPADGRMHTAICSDTVELHPDAIPGGRIYTGWHDAPQDYPN